MNSLKFNWLFTIIFSVGISSFLAGQNIGINTTGAAPTNPTILEILQPSTTDLTVGVWAQHTGAAGAGTTYGLKAIASGASLNSVAAYLEVTGGTNKYALIVPNAGGNVGIGLSAPLSLFHVDGGASFTTQTVATISANSLSSGNLLLVQGPTSGATLTGNLLQVTSASTGAAANGFARFNFSAAHTGNGFQIDDATATGTAMQLNANSITTGAGNGLVINANGMTSSTGNGLLVSSTGVYTGANGIFAVTGNSATSGTVSKISFTGLTSGNGLVIQGPTAGATLTGNLLQVNSASTGAATNGFARFNFSAAHTGNGFQIDDATTTGTAMQLNANSITTGAGNGLVINANGMTSSTGNGLLVSSTGVYTGANGLFAVTGNSATSGTVSKISFTGLTSGNGLVIQGPTAGATLTGNLLQVNSASTGAATNGFARFNFSAAHTGNGFQIDDATTTGIAQAINVNSLTTGTGLNLSSTSVGGNASKLINLNRSGTNTAAAMTNYGIYSSISNTNATSGTNYGGYFSATGAGASIFNVGAVGITDHNGGDGIEGYNTAADVGGYGAGVYGTSNQSLGAGVFGDGGTTTAGVYGASASLDEYNAGVYGENYNNTSGTSWTPTQVTAGVGGRIFGTAAYSTGIYGYNGNSTINNNAAIFGQDGQSAFAGMVFTYTPAATQRTLGLYAVGTGLDVNDRSIQGQWSGTTATDPWGFIGGNSIGVLGQNPGTTAGTTYAATNSGVRGESAGLAGYNFGVHGYDYGTTNRTGGVLGSYGATPWASLGYKSSGAVTYGVYYTSAGTGAGFLPTGEISGIGTGGYGGVIGSWTRGEVMGQISSGEMFASYNLGNSYTSGYSSEIVSLKNKRVAAHSVTSTEIKIYSDGTSKLINGASRVNFEESYSELIGENKPVVTITPMGQCNGIFLSNVDSKGFDVQELNNGKSNTEFSYIIISKRIDSDNKPELPEAISKMDFDDKMKGVMFNENNLEQSATPIWWDGKQIRFDKIPEEKSIRKEEIIKSVSKK